MPCNINWNELNFSEWNRYFYDIPQSTVLQSYDYAKAVCPIYGQKAKWGLIEIDGQKAGLCQVIEASLFNNLIHAITLDRGPLWFKGYGSFSHFEAFCHTFNSTYPVRLLRQRRFIPEVENSPRVDALLKSLNFKKVGIKNYETYWIDLKEEKEALRAALKKKWRNSLNKAEKSPLIIRWDRRGERLAEFLVFYKHDKAQKSYQGASLKVLKALSQVFGHSKNLWIGQAYLESEPCAGILILRHGSSATYQVGWTTDSGRQHNAHHLLLWQAICALKDEGVEFFDLGGVHDEAEGIRKFKEGLGGKLACLPGVYT